MPEPTPSPHRWNQIRRLPLHPGIRTLAQYEAAILQGTVDAAEHLHSVEVLNGLVPADFQAVHYHLFKGVHPWAGEFRSLGQLAVVAGHPAADPGRIHRELELALAQTRQLSAAAAGEIVPMLGVLSFLHARYERIHPFQDGNGRSGRTVLAVQFECLFGHLPDFGDQPGYREALRASNSGDLGPFMRFVARSGNVPMAAVPWPSPYRIAPRFLEAHEAEPSLADDLAWSRSARRGTS
jgi:fido (protein-threonine AMPylation protein)